LLAAAAPVPVAASASGPLSITGVMSSGDPAGGAPCKLRPFCFSPPCGSTAERIGCRLRRARSASRSKSSRAAVGGSRRSADSMDESATGSANSWSDGDRGRNLTGRARSGRGRPGARRGPQDRRGRASARPRCRSGHAPLARVQRRRSRRERGREALLTGRRALRDGARRSGGAAPGRRLRLLRGTLGPRSRARPSRALGPRARAGGAPVRAPPRLRGVRPGDRVRAGRHKCAGDRATPGDRDHEPGRAAGSGRCVSLRRRGGSSGHPCGCGVRRRLIRALAHREPRGSRCPPPRVHGRARAGRGRGLRGAARQDRRTGHGRAPADGCEARVAPTGDRRRAEARADRVGGRARLPPPRHLQHEANLPMRGINARLGYEPQPPLVLVRGPLAPSAG
jgi:hypothetical protein